jgi:hypothetical protein
MPLTCKVRQILDLLMNVILIMVELMPLLYELLEKFLDWFQMSLYKSLIWY